MRINYSFKKEKIGLPLSFGLRQGLGLLILILSFGTGVQAQIKVVVQAKAQEDKVLIEYIIGDTISNRLYTVSLFALGDFGTFPLTKISGDYGKNITIGKHTVVWDALAEMSRFDGKMAIEVRTLPQFAFFTPQRDSRVKRGDPVTFSWFGENASEDELLIELYRYDELLDTLARVSNKTDYTWQVPNDIKPSGGYRIRLIGTEKSGLKAYSLPVTVDNRFPVAYKYAAGGVGLVGVGVLVLQLLRALPPIFGPND